MKNASPAKSAALLKTVSAVKTSASVKTAVSEKATPPDLAIRVLKTGTCPSLSGKSKLTYHIGCLGKSDVQFRIHANSGTGFFSDEWVPLSAILQVIDKQPSGEPFTSFILLPLFRHQSINTLGFLFAALRQEGLVQTSEENKRCYERMDQKAFMQSVKALLDIPTGGKPGGQTGGYAAKQKPVLPTQKLPSKSTQKKKA